MDFKIFRFGAGLADGDASFKDLLGGKGANLAEMAKAGLPVPPGFTIPTTVCTQYWKQSAENTLTPHFWADLSKQVKEGMAHLESAMQYMPLVSVRSGARVSMPGMMDTILNVGLTTETMPLWEKRLGKRAALDCYRRLIQMFGSTAMGVDSNKFEKIITENKKYKFGAETAPKDDSELTVKHLLAIIDRFKLLIKKETGQEFPDTVDNQVLSAVQAVLNSWNSERAVVYRKMHGYPDDWGTAVTIQAMVFGNMNDKSCSGVLFSRDPSSGANHVVGEYLPNAQGEDVVAGIRTPLDLDSMKDWNPKVQAKLIKLAKEMELHFKDMQDMEFTVEDGTLYVLQTRNAKRSAAAAFRVAVEMVLQGMITKEEAFKRVTTKQYLILSKPSIKTEQPAAATGLPASAGVASGSAVFSAKQAVQLAESGPVILITKETTPDDIAGMIAAQGVLTATGGVTSHAAVVARGMDKPCVTGCQALAVYDDHATLGGVTIKTGEKVTIDGATGRVWVGGDIEVVAGEKNEYAEKLLSWAVDNDSMFVKDDAASSKKYKGRVYLETADLDSEEQKAITTKIKHTLTAVCQSGDELKEAVLDLRGMKDYRESDDAVLWGMFGSVVNDKEVLEAKVLGLLEYPPKMAREKVYVVLPAGEYQAKKKLTAEGWKVASKALSVADLLNASGMVDVSPDIAKEIGGEEVLGKLLEVFKKAGIKFTPIPKPVRKERMAFDILGKGG